MPATAFTALACFCALAASPALGACVETAAADIRVVRCSDGLAFAAGATAARSPAALVAAHPRVIQLDDGELAISSAQPAKVLTPDAVVAGIGGEWAVAVENGRTRA